MQPPPSSGIPTPPPAVYLSAYAFSVTLGRVYVMPLHHQATTLHPAVYRLAHLTLTPQGGAQASFRFRQNNHYATSRLPTGVPIWCNSRRGPCYTFPPLGHSHRSQPSTLRRTHLVHLQDEPMPLLPCTRTPTTSGAVYLPMHPFGTTLRGLHDTPPLYKKTQTVPTLLPTGAPT